jgi:hypothetical protein
MLNGSSVIMPAPVDPNLSKKLYGAIGELVNGEEGRKKGEALGSLADRYRQFKESLKVY